MEFVPFIQLAFAPKPSRTPVIDAVPLFVKETEFAIVTLLLKFIIAPAAIDDEAFTETAPEKVMELLSVKIPLIVAVPAMVNAAVPPTDVVLLNVTVPVPVLLNVPAFEIPPPKMVGEVLAVLKDAPELIVSSPENVFDPLLLPSVKLPAVTEVFPAQLKFPAPKAKEPATFVLPETEIAPVAVPTFTVPFRAKLPEIVNELLPDIVTVFALLTVRLIADAAAFTVTEPSITTEFEEDGITPPIQVPGAFQFPPVVVLVMV